MCQKGQPTELEERPCELQFGQKVEQTWVPQRVLDWDAFFYKLSTCKSSKSQALWCCLINKEHYSYPGKFSNETQRKNREVNCHVRDLEKIMQRGGTWCTVYCGFIVDCSGDQFYDTHACSYGLFHLFPHRQFRFHQVQIISKDIPR